MPEYHRIFDHLFLEGMFSAALQTPRGWKGLLIGEGWRDLSPLFVQKDTLNHELSNVRVPTSILITEGPDCKGVWYHSVLLIEEGSSDMKEGNQPLNHPLLAA